MEANPEPASHLALTASRDDDHAKCDLTGTGLNGKETPSQSPARAYCLWCGRAFIPRATGGSAQKFCSTRHRQDFWIAARRWTLMALDAGLLSVDCLKAIQTSVHAETAPSRVGDLIRRPHWLRFQT
jgi:hypothetical protein